MKKTNISETDAINLLKKYAKRHSDMKSYMTVLTHSKLVQKNALILAKKAIKNNKRVDIEFIESSSLLHDIGRFNCPLKGKMMMRHGIEGSKMLKKEDLDNRYRRVCETHIGTGLTKEDIARQKLPLPKKDFRPCTNEEKIICYADLISGVDKNYSIRNMIKRYESIKKGLGRRVLLFHNRVMKMTGQLHKIIDKA